MGIRPTNISIATCDWERILADCDTNELLGCDVCSPIKGTPQKNLGHVDAPDEETAREQAIEFYSIPASQQFRVVAVRIEGAKKVKVNLETV